MSWRPHRWAVAAGLAALLAACATSTLPPAAPPSQPSSLPATPSLSASVSPTPTLAPSPTPEPPPSPSATSAPLVADPCVDRDLAAPLPPDVSLTVLDRSYALDATFVPGSLVAIGQAGFAGDHLVAATIVPDLAALAQDASAAGLALIVDSAYRSYEQQAATFDHWVAQVGYDAALQRTARPGHSEHQLGTAIDFDSPGWSGRFGDWASETPEGAWLFAHAWEYGFVLSYPWAAETTTCFGYEPWQLPVDRPRRRGRASRLRPRAAHLPRALPTIAELMTQECDRALVGERRRRPW